MDVFNGVILGHQTKEGFVRDSLIQLYSASDAPESIDSIELRDVNESVYQLLGCSAEFDVDYTAEIGYDRQEPYITYEKYKERIGDRTVTLERPVTKYKTVIDWRPHSGRTHKSGAGLIRFTDNDTMDYGDLDPEVSAHYDGYRFSPGSVLVDGAHTVDDEIVSQYAFTEPNDRELGNALAVAMAEAETDVKCELPGDHERNFRAQSAITDASFSVLAVKRYKTSFEFRDQTHFIKQFVSDKQPTIYCSARYSDTDANKIAEAKRKELDSDPVVTTNEKYANNAKLIGFGCLCFSFLLAFFLTFQMFIFGLIGAGISFAAGSFFGKKANAQKEAINARYSSDEKDHFLKLQEKKIHLLNNRLAMMGQEPLNAQELEQFSEKNKHQLDANYKA